MNKVIEYIKSEVAVLLAKMEQASLQGHPQDTGDRKEDAVRNIIEQFYPYPYQLTKGKIIDSLGNDSNSIDCIVLGANHPRINSNNKNFHDLILCEGVEFAIEVKPDIQSYNELKRGLKQIISVKKLERDITEPYYRNIHSDKPPQVNLEMEEREILSKKIPCVIFSNKCKTDPMETAKEVQEYYRTHSVPIEHQIDAIVINGVGIIFNYKITAMAPPQHVCGLYFENWGEYTMARFLLFLTQMPSCEMRISPSFLPKYLDNIFKDTSGIFCTRIM